MNSDTITWIFEGVALIILVIMTIDLTMAIYCLLKSEEDKNG